MPTTTPSWCKVPKAPLSGVGDTSPTYIGVKPVKRPQKRPMTSRPAITISYDEHKVEKPISSPPITARMLTRIMERFLRGAPTLDRHLRAERADLLRRRSAHLPKRLAMTPTLKDPAMPPMLKMATVMLHTLVQTPASMGSP